MVMSETYLPVYLIRPKDNLKPSSYMSADFQKKWNEGKHTLLNNDTILWKWLWSSKCIRTMLSSYVIHQNLYLLWIARDKVVVFNTYKESLVSSNAKHFWGLLDFLQFQTDYAAFHVVYLPCTHFIICCMLVIVLRNFRLKCLDDEKGLIMERMRREKMLTSWINKGNTFIIITICKICVFSIMRIFNYAYFQLCALVLSVFLIHKKHI